MSKLLLMFLFVFAPATIFSQGKPITPPGERAPAAEQQKWLLSALAKYAAYSTPTMSVKISGPKIQACVLTITQTKKFGSTSKDDLIITTRTDSVTEKISIELGKLDLASMKLADHIFPELSTFSFRIRPSETTFRDVELVLQQPAADAIKTTLERVARACAPGV